MAHSHYMVRYSLGSNNNCVYPEGVAGVVWKSVVYQYTEQVMVGEADARVKTDGKQVIALTSVKAKKLISVH